MTLNKVAKATAPNNLKPKSTRHKNFKEKPDARQTAQYIADMVLELRNMAVAAEQITLQGLLEVTFYEAFSTANKVEISTDEIEHLRELSKASVE